MTDNNLTLSPEKTEAVMVRGRRNSTVIGFQLDGRTITSSKEVKYLEVWLVQRLSFGTHVKNAAIIAEKQKAAI